MNTMSYKGCLGSVAFSKQNGVFCGNVEGINGFIRKNLEEKAETEIVVNNQMRDKDKLTVDKLFISNFQNLATEFHSQKYIKPLVNPNDSIIFASR